MIENDSLTNDWLSHWPPDLQVAGCEGCDRTFLLSPQQASILCPHCGERPLTPYDAAADRPVYTQPPELVAPFEVDRAAAQQRLADFVRRGIFAPEDLTAHNLSKRLQPLFLPTWLVDTAVSARWEAEMGFDYDVVSHREQYKNGKWITQRYTETKVRWEPRLGTLAREYHNLPAPALEEQAQIEESFGRYRPDSARAFRPQDLDGALVRLPNRPPQDAWSEAQLACQQRAAAECRQAAGADHARQFRWSPQFSGQNWTQLLYPLYSSYYVGDDGRTYVVFIHGQSGKLDGFRRASMQKAKRWSLIIGALAGLAALVGGLLFLAGTLLQNQSLLPPAGALLTAAFWIALGALLPLIAAVYNNHFHTVAAAQQLAKGVLNVAAGR